MVKGILFDLDGTLVDSLAATFDAFNHGITQLGGRKHSGQEIMSYFGPGEGQIFAKILGPQKAERAYALARTYMDKHLGEVPLHQGVDELLQKLISSKVPMSIVTGRSWDTTELILKHHGILDQFITVVANDHVDAPKPSPDGIRLALSRMKLEPHETCYVGDSHVDILASHSAGSQSIAALWDLKANKEILASHNPHLLASHPLEIWEYWKKNN